MSRAIVSKQTLDRLIQSRLAEIEDCVGAAPMPVQVSRNGRKGCNWEVPGFTGSASAVQACQRVLERYLDLLCSEFDVYEES